MQEQIEFIIPDGYIKDEENTTDKKVVYKLEKKSSIAKNWEEVCKEMFLIKKSYLFIDLYGSPVEGDNVERYYDNKNNITSEAQGEKLMAINQLLTVAKYLNDLNCFNDGQDLTSIYVSDTGVKIGHTSLDFIYFKSPNRARKAIEILGENVIRLALTANNY